MFKFESRTGIRPTKDLGCQIIAAPTNGHIKVTPEASTALQVVAKDFVDIVVNKVDSTIWAVKGDEDRGGKLAASNKSGAGTLTFSSAVAWADLQGDTNSNVYFTMAKEPILVSEEGELVEEMAEGVKAYFALTFEKSVEKQARKKKAVVATDSVETNNDLAVEPDSHAMGYEETTDQEDTSFEEI